MVTAPPKPAPAAVDSESTVAAPVWDGDPLVIQFPPGILTDELFGMLAEMNDWYLERNCEGGLEVSPSPKTLSGLRGARIFSQLLYWSDESGGGECFTASTGFSLSVGSLRDPDASWLSDERLADIDMTSEEYWQVCPDLVVEVRSQSDRIRRLQDKMDEWMRAGARLGWLIDPFTDDGVAWIYREGADGPERQARPATLSGEGVAEGLVVELAKVWRRSTNAGEQLGAQDV